MRRPLIAGNWKMNLDVNSGVELARSLVEVTADVEDRDILICPGFPLLSDISSVINGSRIMLGAQNMYYEKQGAFTGEVSADMLKSVGCSYVILGHSERRHIFGEGDELINKKVSNAIKFGLKPILCVGELLEEREAGKTEEIVKNQVIKGLKGITESMVSSLTIAYEPVWAIGTGKTATPEDANHVHILIRNVVSDLYSTRIAENLRILYGGSVKPENIDALMAMDNIDGALVGGASLKLESFERIVKFKV